MVIVAPTQAQACASMPKGFEATNPIGIMNAQADNWELCGTSRSQDVIIGENNLTAYFHTDPCEGSQGTAGVRGSRGFVDGEHYWEIRLLEPAAGASLMIGVGTANAQLHSDNLKFFDLIGQDNESWGLSYKGSTWHGGKCEKAYCAPFYAAGTIIGVHLNLYAGTLTYYKDGHSLGVAYSGLNHVCQPLYPMLSSTAPETELEVGVRCCRYLTLHEKCCLTVARSLKRKADIELLPLPFFIKRHLQDDL